MLRAHLLGALEVELDGTAVTPPPSQRPWALFAYLALEGRPVVRGELIARFWPDVLDRSARASLRSALWSLRRTLGDSLHVDGERIGLRDGAGTWVDVHEFERLASIDPEDALRLCRGELLEGLDDDWALLARDRHRERVMELLEELARTAELHGDGRRAVELSRQQVRRDPFDEQAHRRLIGRLVTAGDRASALRVYEMLATRLRRQLGVTPAEQTREMIAGIRVDPPAVARGLVAAPGLPPLVGRDRELAQLDATWRSARAGAGVAALISGGSGVGKTRLAGEARAHAVADGGRSVSATALGDRWSPPFGLWAEIARELLPLAPALTGDLAVLVSGRPGAAPELERRHLFGTVVTLLEAAARQAPLLIVLEDIHVADRPSLELAAHAATRLDGSPLMMLLTRRGLPPSAHADALERELRARSLIACEIELEPPSIAVSAPGVGAPDEDARPRVRRRPPAGVAAAVRPEGLSTGGADEVASGLRASIGSVLASLSEEARRFLQLAAVATRPLESVEIDHLPLVDPYRAATSALATGLLQSVDARIGFRHSLLRDACYAGIAEPLRRDLHRQWAGVLRASERAGAMARPAQMAGHLRLADLADEAVPELIRASARARALAAPEHAATYIEEAIAIAPQLPELWIELGDLEASRGRAEQARTAFARALSLLRG